MLFIRFYSVVIVSVLIFSVTAKAQKTKPVVKPTPKVSKNLPKTAVKPVDNPDAVAFDEAQKNTDLSEKISALRKFKATFPNSESHQRACELIVSAYAQLADEKLRNNEAQEGIEFFKKAVKEAPQPVSDVLFLKVLAQIPTNLFYGGQQTAALEIAKLIETKINGSAKQLLGLATFYIGIEDGKNAKNLAEIALVLEPNSFNSYQTLGLANRLLFDLQAAETAYQTALELEPSSFITKRSLADMKRAIGKPLEAETIYRELLNKDENDESAKTGLILSLFDADKISEAESELAKTIEKNPNNFMLAACVGYWYAAHNNDAKAFEFAGKAVSIEPRFVWGQIALARSLQRRPLDAERSLLVAQKFGNFPTLIYELATARVQSGFFNEAAVGLRTGFIVAANDMVATQLGNRVPNQAKNFIQLLSLERRVSILQPLAADSLENADRLKALLKFSQKLDSKEPNESEIIAAADEFVAGNDSAKTHRQLYVAGRMLKMNIGLEKIIELSKSAISGVDVAANMPNAATATMADELFESRATAFSRGGSITIPQVPVQTLTSILRGRIEETQGSAYFQQQKFPESIIHLKRAVGIYPDKSIWLRTSQWKLGTVYEANKNLKDALEFYIKSYKASEPNFAKYSAIESLFQTVNGNTNGLTKQIGEKPKPFGDEVSQIESNTKPNSKPTPTPTPIAVEPKNPSIEKTPVETVAPSSTDESRPRIAESKPNCSLISSQDSVSILNNGGRLGILMTIEGDGKPNEIIATSSSKDDIEVAADVDMVKNSNRIFYVIKSISEKTGEFSVLFELPCGKKEVLVRVR